MTKTILTTRFNFSMSAEKLNEIMPAVAPGFSKIPGCCWKIWVINEQNKEAGGVYLFESPAELEAFLNSGSFATVTENPAFSNLQVNTFAVVEAASIITGAPLFKTS